MYIVEQAVRAYQEQADLAECKFVHPSMINYGNCILPPGTGLQHGLLQACAKRLEYPLLYRAFAAKVLDKKCVNIVYFAPPTQEDNPAASSSAVSLETASDPSVSLQADTSLAADTSLQADTSLEVDAPKAKEVKSNKRRRKGA